MAAPIAFVFSADLPPPRSDLRGSSSLTRILVVPGLAARPSSNECSLLLEPNQSPRAAQNGGKTMPHSCRPHSQTPRQFPDSSPPFLSFLSNLAIVVKCLSKQLTQKHDKLRTSRNGHQIFCAGYVDTRSCCLGNQSGAGFFLLVYFEEDVSSPLRNFNERNRSGCGFFDPPT